LQENYFTGTKAAAVTTLKTRSSKKQINRDTLMASQNSAFLSSSLGRDQVRGNT